MKNSLVLPNGRNAIGMSKEDIYFTLHGRHTRDYELRMQLNKERQTKLQITLDNWKLSGYTHKNKKPIRLKLGDS